MSFTTLRVTPRWTGLLVLVAALFTLLYVAPSISAQSDASVSIANVDVTDEQVTVNVQAENPSGTSSVHGRYRETASTSWIGLGSLSISTGTASLGIPTADLEAGTEYLVQVSLDSDYPEGDRTASATFTTPEAPQPAVTQIRLNGITRTSVQVTVLTSDAAAGSTVHLQQRVIGTHWSDANGNLIVQDDGSASHTLSGLSAGTRYSLRASFDDNFPREATKTALFVTDPLPVLGGISVEEITGSSATVTVTVDNFDPELDAIHLRYGEGSPPSVWHSGPEPDGGIFRLSGLRANTVYTVQASLDGDFTVVKAAEFTTPPVEPDPPANVRITDEGDGSLGVAWDVPPSDGGSEITGYRVQWRSGDEEFEASREAEVSDTAHPIAGLVNGAAYTVRVLAVNGVGASQPSAEVSGTPSTTPAAPVITESTVTPDSIMVSWSAPDGGGAPITGYEVQWKSGDEEFDPTRQADASDTTYTIGDLSAGVDYEVRVRAANSNGAGGWSETFAASTSGPPGEPTNVRLSHFFGHGSLRLDWDEPSDTGTTEIIGYTVELSLDSAFSTILISDSEGTRGRSFYELTPHVDHYARVRASNASGGGPWSDVVSNQPLARPAAPVITSLAPGDQELTVTWEPLQDVDGSLFAYAVEYRTSEDPPFPDYETTRIQGYPTRLFVEGTTSRTITGLTNGTQYWVRVHSVSTVDWGDISEVVTGTPSASILPAPTITATTATTDSIALNWDPPSSGPAVTSYEVQWQWSGGGFNPEPNRTATGISETSYTITGLFEDQHHAVRVKAFSGDIESAWSAIHDISTLAGIPDQPTNLQLYTAAGSRPVDPVTGRLFGVGHGQLVVEWEPPNEERDATFFGRPLRASSITGYLVEWSLNADFSDSSSKSVDGGHRQLIISGLSPHITYYVRVEATTASGEGLPSEALSAQPLSRAGAPTITRIEQGDGYFIVHWDPPSDDGGTPILAYYLQYRTSDDQPFSTNSDNTGSAYQNTIYVPLGETSGNIDGLENDVDYEIRVYAGTSICCGHVSQTVTGTPTASPLAPPTITGTVVTTRSITVNWAAPSDGPEVTSYHLQWKSQDDLRFLAVPDLEATGLSGTSYTINRLKHDTDYDIRVRAVSDDIGGAWSALSTVRTQAATPTQPTDVALQTAGHGELRASWEPPYRDYDDNDRPDVRASSITEYRVEWSLNRDFGDSTSISLDGSHRELTITGLTPLTTYYVRVAASTLSGEGPPSRILAAQPPSRPGLPAITDVSPGDGQLTVTWITPTDGANVTGYRVQWKSGEEEFGADNRQATTVDTNHTIAGLTNDTLYEVRVIAYNDIGDSEPSDSMSGTPAAPQE